MLETENLLTQRSLDHETRIAALEAKLSAMTIVAGDIPANVVTADASGNVTLAGIFQAKSVQADSGTFTSGVVAGEADIKSLKMGSDTSGSDTLKAGDTEIKIGTSEVKSDSKIYITPTGSTSGKILYVKKDDIVPGKSFKVKFDGASADADITFNWLIVN